MKLSLIVATYGRSAELRRLLASISHESGFDMELVIVDQNSDDRVIRVIEEFQGTLPIVRIESRPGATRARNAGLAIATGDIVGFPDDDCWYPEGVVARVMNFMDESADWDGIIGHTVDAEGVQTLPWRDKAGPLTRGKSWRRSVTYVYFLRKRIVDVVGGFDVRLGPGAGTPWGAGDDNDYMLTALERGARVFFEPELRVHHPPMFLGFNDTSIKKRASYSRADGRVLRKHGMPVWWVCAFFAVPLVRLLLSIPLLERNRLRFHWATFVGRYQGFADRTPL